MLQNIKFINSVYNVALADSIGMGNIDILIVKQKYHDYHVNCICIENCLQMCQMSKKLMCLNIAIKLVHTNYHDIARLLLSQLLLVVKII